MRKMGIFYLILTSLLIWPVLVLGQTTGQASGGNKPALNELNQQIAEKKKRIEEIEKALAEYKKKIEATKLEQISLVNQTKILDNRIAQVGLTVKATEERLAENRLEISRLELGIEDKTRIIERQLAMLAELIRHLHRENNKKQIEIMAAYDNFSDFYNRLQYLQKIEADLGASAKTVRLARTELEGKRARTEAEKKRHEELNQELEERQKELQGQVDYKQKLLAETQSSEQKYKTLVTSLKSQYQQIEAEVSSIEREVRRRLEAEQKNKPAQFDERATALSWPSSSRRITAYFHDVTYPYRQIFEHNAIDIVSSHGTPVKAAAACYVARAKKCTSASCYSYIMLVHGSGVSTVYGHLSRLAVDEEQFVARGDLIGYSGATPGTVGAGPFTTGPHLHFEVRKNGIPTDPLGYLPD